MRKLYLLTALIAAAFGLIIGTAGMASAGSSPAARTMTTPHGASPVSGTVHLFATPHAPATLTMPGLRGKEVQASPLQVSIYEILNVNSGKCMEVYHSQLNDYANVDQYTCNGTDTQYWEFVPVGTVSGGYVVYQLVNYNSGLCAEVYHSETQDGANVDQFSCNGTYTQYWILDQSPSTGISLFENLNSGKVLEVYDSSTANYGNVDQWASNGTATQYWYI
jgi:hypothetical protein